MADVTGYKQVNLCKLPLADKPVKIDGVLAVPFDPIIRIQTEDLLTAMTPLCTKGEDGNVEMMTSMTAKATGAFLTFLKQFEKSVLGVAKKESSKWWPRKNFDDTVIEHGFKSYMKGADVFKLRVDTDVEPLVYDEQGLPADIDAIRPGQRFWAVLEAHRVVIGKNEFGLVWKLHQIMWKPANACLVVPQPQKQKVTVTDDDLSDFN